MTLNHHKKACRKLKFSTSGERLYTASKDKSLQIIDLNHGKVFHKFMKAHEAPIYSLLVIDDYQLVSGDDDGTVKVWDLRHKDAIMEFKENEEFISDLYIDQQKKILLATSGEGTLTAFNIRKKRMELQSESFDAELLSLAVVKRGNKVVCGTGEGVLSFFNWGEWGNISDRFPGHPMSIDCMVPITEDIICTGSMDGMIRAVNILPNRFIGVVGQHDGFPIENMCISQDKTLLASCSHDQKIKFWNLENVKKEKIDQTRKAKKSNKTKTLNTSAVNSNFFADLEERTDEKVNDCDNDSDDDDDESDSDEDTDDEGGVECKEKANGDDENDSGSDSEDNDDDDDDDDDDSDNEEGEED
ncbi:WD repeat-containing protein 55-like isoform X2 [Lineus longissimus]